MGADADTAELGLATGGQIHAVPPGRTLQIGRGAQCEIWLDSPAVSRVHAKVTERGGALIVEDSGSRNGVQVNGERIAGPTPLRVGDRITLGDRVLVVSSLERTRLRTEPRSGALPIPSRADRPPFAPESATSSLLSRATETQQTTYAIFLETARGALGQGRHAAAYAAAGQLCEALERIHDPSMVERPLVEAVPPLMIALAERSGDVVWIERLLRIRQHFGIALDARSVEDASRQIESLPPGPDTARRADVSWAQSQPLRFTDRAALKRLADATSKRR